MNMIYVVTFANVEISKIILKITIRYILSAIEFKNIYILVHLIFQNTTIVTSSQQNNTSASMM